MVNRENGYTLKRSNVETRSLHVMELKIRANMKVPATNEVFTQCPRFH